MKHHSAFCMRACDRHRLHYSPPLCISGEHYQFLLRLCINKSKNRCNGGQNSQPRCFHYSLGNIPGLYDLIAFVK